MSNKVSNQADDCDHQLNDVSDPETVSTPRRGATPARLSVGAKISTNFESETKLIQVYRKRTLTERLEKFVPKIVPTVPTMLPYGVTEPSHNLTLDYLNSIFTD